MRSAHALVAAGLAVLALVACGGEAAVDSGVRVAAPRGEISADDFSRSLFGPGSTTIDNPWVAYAPGKQFHFRGWTEEEGERIPHRIVFTVTDLVKTIGGVRVVVGWDRDFSGGGLVEAELIFLAEDKYGNVWHLGQYSEIWEGKTFVGGQAWMAGHYKGAKAGIHMPARPRLGLPPYSEGFAPAPFFWDDFGKVVDVDQKTCAPVGCFQDVLVVDEYEPTKPGAFQVKYYARGVGLIRVGWKGKDADHEVLVLEKVVRLGAKALAKARAEALKLETRAYVYGSTEPAQRRAGGEG